MQSSIDIEAELSLSLPSVSFEEKERREGEESGFIRVLSKARSLIINSPLYHTLSVLIAEESPLVNGFRIDLAKNREAFFIHLNSFPAYRLSGKHSIFKEYQFKERHFSIDKIYRTSERQHGYSPLHYTERYESGSTSIIVHVYLSQQGQFLYSQTKKYDADSPEGVDMKVDAELRELLKTNVSASIGAVLPLFNERQERYEKLKKEADRLEDELNKLSRSLESHVSLEAYKVKAREFIKKIHELNHYTELLDPRANNVETTLKKLEEWAKKVQQPAKRELQPIPTFPLTESIPDEAALPVVEKKESSEERLYKELVAELETLQKKLSKKIDYSLQALKDIENRHAIIEEINQKLMALFEFSDEFLNQDIRKKQTRDLFNTLNKRVIQHETEGLKLLKQEALKGNLVVVEKLFVFFGSKLDKEFYGDLLGSLVTNKDKTAQNKLISVCQFFNEATEVYKIAVLNLSKQASYILPKREANKLFSQEQFRKMNFDFDCDVSILFRLYCDRNLQAFKMLLEHGADANTWGITKRDNQRKMLSIFQSVIIFHVSDYVDYLNLLIHYGADINSLVTPEDYHTSLREKLQSLKEHRGKEKKIALDVLHEMEKKGLSENNSKQLRRELEKGKGKGRALMKALSSASAIMPVSVYATIEPPIVFVINRGHSDIFRMLQPHLSTDGIAYAFAKIADNHEDIFSMSFSTSYPYCAISPVTFFDEPQQALTMGELLAAKPGPFLGIFLWKNPNCKVEVGVKFEMLKKLYNMLAERLVDIDLKQFDEIYQRLFKYGVEQNALSGAGKQTIHAYHYLSACLFLLTTASISRPEDETLTLISRYYGDWFKQMKLALKDRFTRDPEALSQITGVYESWVESIQSALELAKRQKPQRNIEAPVVSEPIAENPTLSSSSAIAQSSSTSSLSSSEPKEKAEGRALITKDGSGVRMAREPQAQADQMVASAVELSTQPVLFSEQASQMMVPRPQLSIKKKKKRKPTSNAQSSR